MVKEIRKHNDEQFLIDLKRCYTIMVYAPTTKEFFSITKSDLIKRAIKQKISYYVTNKIFVTERLTLVVI